MPSLQVNAPDSNSNSHNTGVKSDGIDFGIPIRFKDGMPKPAGQNYSKVLVVPKMKSEDLGWIESELPDMRVMAYEVDNEEAELRVPKNKGREAMVCCCCLTLGRDEGSKLIDRSRYT